MKGIKSFFVFFLVSVAFLNIIHVSALACKLSGKHRYISLSGPVTFTLGELHLLQDKNLEGISIFNPIDKTEKKRFQGTVYGGGMFLAQKKLPAFEGRVVFYDSGREQKKQFRNVKNIHAIEVKTRGMDTLESGRIVLKTLSPYLINCDERIETLNKKLSKLKAKLKAKRKAHLGNDFKHSKLRNILFYLGKISHNKRPNLLIVNDGPIKTLLQYQVIKSYPSDLNYVNWSQKLINKLDRPIHIGLSEGVTTKPVMKKVAPRNYNVSYRGILTPGLSQLQFLEHWLTLSPQDLD